MDVKDFLKAMKEDVLDTEKDLTMDTSLSDIEEWDSLSVVSFLALVKKLNNKTGKNHTDVNVKMVQGARTIQDLFNLLNI